MDYSCSLKRTRKLNQREAEHCDIAWNNRQSFDTDWELLRHFWRQFSSNTAKEYSLFKKEDVTKWNEWFAVCCVGDSLLWTRILSRYSLLLVLSIFISKCHVMFCFVLFCLLNNNYSLFFFAFSILVISWILWEIDPRRFALSDGFHV